MAMERSYTMARPLREPRKPKLLEFSPEFDALRIKLSSPETIRGWSHGEVKKPETINYRSFRPERDGLFCEKIFGPTKDWECFCGKYKRMKFREIVCDRCGVEVTLSKVRRYRMGHIELASPVIHIWFLKGIPSRIGYLLDLSVRDLERVAYYESYMVMDQGHSPFKKGKLISEEEYQKIKGQHEGLKVRIGAEAIREMLREIDLAKLGESLREDIKKTASVQKKKDYLKRLKIVESFRRSGNKPEWMVLEAVPVLPPDLRPLVPLDGGRFASSDLNDLYRRLINRNNRLKRLIELRAPSIIIHNEKRMLQEAVDALFDNGRRGRPVRGQGNRPLKSFSDMLKGKQGRFRQNLLGKRVDYSGRSVIVVGPELKLYQCGLPKFMALELFKPFIIKKLEERGIVHTLKGAKRALEAGRPEVWDILEEVIKEHPVLLNRAPTLHRQGIQGFQPLLVEGKAIRIHPMVCTAFNADFDGDQMAVHVPLSPEAQVETRMLMLSPNNIFSTSSGKPLASATQDVVLGCYYLTKARPGARGEGKTFSSPDEVSIAFEAKAVELHAKVKVRVNGKIHETTVGRVLFNQILPEKFPFVNKEVEKKELGIIVTKIYRMFGRFQTLIFLDRMKEMGFQYATQAGITVSINDMIIPAMKKQLLAQGQEQAESIEKQYKKGIITAGERYNKVIDVWTHVTDNIADQMWKDMSQDRAGFNPIFMMAYSGSRGSVAQVKQLAGMRGLMAKPQQRITGDVGEIIEHPIISNLREGLTVLEYFISTHGARKGLADTALKTADAGYLTRRLVDVAQEVIITEDDCGTVNGITVGAIREGADIMEPLKDRIVGRVALDNVTDVLTDEIVVHSNEEISEELAERIEAAAVEKIRIRSVLTCQTRFGTCAKCYGWNLGTGKLVELGETVGVVAAQSIGEPGTQLTLRTFHIGGTASRVVEQSRIEVKHTGTVKFHNLRTLENRDGQVIVITRTAEVGVYDDKGHEKQINAIPYGALLGIKEGASVKSGEVIATWDLYTIPIFTRVTGKVEYKDILENTTYREEVDETTGLRARVIMEHKEENLHPRVTIQSAGGEEIASHHLPASARIIVRDGEKVQGGDILAKIPRQISKTRDITGGLPRVAELFEARKPKDASTISEIDGTVHLGEIVKGLRKITIKHESGVAKDYLVPQTKHIIVQDEDRVAAGDPLTDGPINPHDILRVRGERATQEYLVEKIQEVYRLQGVHLNDKHIETIVRQMLHWVRVEDPGDTNFLANQQVDRFVFKEENDNILKKKKKPAAANPILLGITKASLSTESFIAAASFQETTRVLTEAAMSGKVDMLRGLKENVIMGHLIPAGVGMDVYRRIEVYDETLPMTMGLMPSEGFAIPEPIVPAAVPAANPTTAS